MPFETKTRYGAQERFDSEADIASVVERLLNELETEQHEVPDDEHTQIAISNGDWSLTIHVSGLMELGALGWITGSPDDADGPGKRR